MNDIKFDHSKNDFFKALGIQERDVKKFMIDIEEDGGEQISQSLQYIWDSDTSIEMKICTFYMFGRASGARLQIMEFAGGEIIKAMKGMKERLDKDHE